MSLALDKIIVPGINFASLNIKRVKELCECGMGKKDLTMASRE